MARVTASRHGEWFDLICACGYTHESMLLGKKHLPCYFNGSFMCAVPKKADQKMFDESIDETKRHFGRIQEGL